MILNYLNRAFALKMFFQIILVVFALTPCSIKDTYFLQNNIQSSKSLNASKLPYNTVNTCSFVLNQLIESESKQEKKQSFTSSAIITDEFKFATNLSPWSKFSTNQSNAPPFYILYKQLKVATIA